MVASVALRNEGPGQNIEVRANNYLFWGTNFEDVEHVLETKHVRIIGKIMSIFCRQIHPLFLKRKKNFVNFLSNILIASSPSKAPCLRCIQLEVDS